MFLNPPDIGGRYSALTYVGLVPASLLGLDLDALLASASAMLAACREPDPEANPGLYLGLAIGALAREGRDKLTFLADPEISSFGAWAEQLIAESTGKKGVGIVPVDGEPLGEASRLRRGSGLRPADPGRQRAAAGGRRAARRARRGRAPGHPDRAARPDRHRRRVRALGGRDGHRRRGAGHRPVRPAQRRGGQGAHPAPARGPRRGRRRAPRPGRPRRPMAAGRSPATASSSTATPSCG